MLHRLLRKRRGSAMVEFALVAPLLILILLGIMVMGVVINSKIVVAGAAREAGRTWAIVKEDGTARAKAADAINGGGLKITSDSKVLFNAAQDVQFQRMGDYIRVTVTYRQPTFVPLLAQLIDPSSPVDGTITLRSQAIFRVER
ncbi:MAG TPA: TadE/TadG family type IV pilus assembly protein [Symbiobacteriaceae bacterium]|nr:TadE/TadG family type IV pilus assembly protein [Symbiobacteriaceae bacterium]